MPQPAILITIDDHVATLTLNRPEVSNAFDDHLITVLTERLHGLAENDNVRAVVLRGAGKHFCAGADLNWMRRMAGYSQEENLADSLQLANLMGALRRLPKPTIAVVHGAAFGGGVGLVACCDIVFATERASFCLSEVKLGLVPAVISPFLVEAMGPRNARRYFLTAERFFAEEAQRIGLVHEVYDQSHLEDRLAEVLRNILNNGPMAVTAAKRLADRVSPYRVDEAMEHELATLIAYMRAGEEGKEGMAAFLEKRKPSWQKHV